MDSFFGKTCFMIRGFKMFSVLRSLFGQTSAKSPAKSQVTNRGAGSLPGLETLESRLTPSAVTENQVVNLFRVFLDRVPHSSGLSSWSRALDSGRISVAQLADQLLQSTEYGERVVNKSFNEYLGRDIDSGGSSSFVTVLGNGVSQERVKASILGSTEYFAKQGGGNLLFVQSLYSKVLGREADAAGLKAHLAALAGGASRTQVAYAFLSSAEHGRQVTREAYHSIFGREPRAFELFAWSGLYSRSANGSRAVWTGVAASSEGTGSSDPAWSPIIP
jgi:hypothetical protein